MPTEFKRCVAIMLCTLLVMPLCGWSNSQALAGESIELSLRGLAQLQRWQEEKALRDKLQALMDSASPPTINAAQRHKPVELTQPVVVPAAGASAVTKPSTESAIITQKPVAGYTPLLVYGSPPALTVEAQTPGGEIHRFSEQATWGHWRVERISADGVWLRHGKNADRRFVALGDVLKETEQP